MSNSTSQYHEAMNQGSYDNESVSDLLATMAATLNAQELINLTLNLRKAKFSEGLQNELV